MAEGLAVTGGERLAGLRLVPFSPAGPGLLPGDRAPGVVPVRGVPVVAARALGGGVGNSSAGTSAAPAAADADGVEPVGQAAPVDAGVAGLVAGVPVPGVAAGWCVPGVPQPVSGAGGSGSLVVSPVVAVVVAAVQRLVAAPRSGSPGDVAAVGRLAEQLRGVALAELAELDVSGGYLAAGAPSAAVWLRDSQDGPLSDVTARGRVRLARRLRAELPELGALLRQGRTTAEHVQAVAAGTAGLDGQLVSDSQRELCALVRATDPGTVRRVLAQRAAAVRPELAEQVAARAHERRAFHADQVLGDYVALAGSLGCQDGQVLLLGLDLQVQADRQAGDLRSLPQRRADAVVGWARQAASRLAGPGDSLAEDAHTVRSSLLISCTLGQLQALAAAGPAPDGPAGGQGGPGEPGGPGGPGGLFEAPAPPQLSCCGAVLPGQALRRITCDATVTLLVDGAPRPAGELRATNPLYLGRSTRTVSGAQFKALVHRDRHCVVKGCRRRPAQCEAHHVKHWADGGATDLDNLVLLCHLHHHDHHDRGHTLQHHDGRWLTATGWGTDPP